MRLKLLLRFFISPDTAYHLRGLAEEFGDSTNAVRTELKKLEDAGILISKTEGNKILFSVNQSNPFYRDMLRVVKRYLGLETVVEDVLDRLGAVREVYVVGDYALGIDSGRIEVVLIGDVDETYLAKLAKSIAQKIGREVVLARDEYFSENCVFLKLL
jgi:DNA-binding transcriptional ArsR family regulator